MTPDRRREVEELLRQNLPDDTETQVTPGTQLGPYRIEGLLGAGGMGQVFRALDTRLGRHVALKISQEQFSARFEREARTIAALHHPHICTLYDVGPSYLVMELLEGETLAARLKRGRLPIAEALEHGRQIADALAAAHAKSIVHRDLKPANIMLTESGVKVLDFGLAKSDEDETLTGSRVVMGTPAYMAPEQRAGQPADARTDLYAFGCVLYEMLTGARATPGREPVPSRALEEVVARCLAENPAQRWQSAADLAGALHAAPRAGKKRLWIVAGAALLATLVIAAYVFRPTPKLTDKDTIVLADVVNNTNDPVFDGTLRQGLAIQLEQSPFLKIMDDEQVQGVLRLMGLPPGSRITHQVAHDICIREGASAAIEGEIAALGTNYVITLQAITSPAGTTLAREQIQVQDKEHVLSALSTAATAMRGKLGESLSTIQKLNRPLEEATTSSLEALQNYNAGMSEMGQGRFLAAVPLFERAVALDPNFAMAYGLLEAAYANAGDAARARQYSEKAFRLIDRVSERERSMIAEAYYEETGEADKAIDEYRANIRNYPRFWASHNDLSELYLNMGRYEEGLKEGLEAARLQPDLEPPYRRLLDSYMCLDRLPEAREVRDQLRAAGRGGARIHQRFLELAYLDGDQAAADREMQWFAGKPEEYLSLGLQAANRNVHGQRRESHKLFQRAAETALRLGLRGVASEFEEADARADALAGNCQTASRLGRPAVALALCGDAPQAEKVAAETAKLSPKGTIWNAVQLPEIRAASALQRGQPARSVELLASAAPYEGAYLEATYLRGLAYLRLEKGAEAAAEFRKITDHKGANWGASWIHPYWGQFYSLSFLGAARGFVLAGDTAKAAKAFQDFFELWKDADAEVPILHQAKAEYTSLR